jgi:antitoxin component YwqK of YwqJK toxin-antitoxin module
LRQAIETFLSPPAAPAAPASASSEDGVAQIVEEHDEAGRLAGRASMMAGVPHGESTRYAPDGTLLLQANFAHGALNGPLRSFDEQGVPLQHAHYLNGKAHGVVTVYQEGCLAARQHYVHGVLHGESVSYAPSGLVTSRMTYEAGKLDREALFMTDGVIVRRMNYRLGLLEGETREYARDGALVQSSPYRANLLHGTVRRFAPDGSVIEERAFQQGKPQGEWRKVDAAPAPGSAPAAPRLVKHFEKWVRG